MKTFLRCVCVVFLLAVSLTACMADTAGALPLPETVPSEETSASAETMVPETAPELPAPAVIQEAGYTLTEIQISEQYPEDVYPAVYARYIVPGTEYIITEHNAVYPNSLAITEMYQYGIADRQGRTLVPCLYDEILYTNRGEFILIGGPEDGLYDDKLNLVSSGNYWKGYEVLDQRYFYLYNGTEAAVPTTGFLCLYTEPVSDVPYREVLYRDGQFLAYWYDTDTYEPGLDILDMDGNVLSHTVITEEEFGKVLNLEHPSSLERTALTVHRDANILSLLDAAGEAVLSVDMKKPYFSCSPVTEDGEAVLYDGEKSWLLTIRGFTGTYLP